MQIMDLLNIINPQKHNYPVIVSIPHSGTFVPIDIRDKMLPNVILSNTDWFLKELYSFLETMDITTISSNISRYVVDLNRDPSRDIKGKDYRETIVYDCNTFGTPLYSDPLSCDEIQKRINQYYVPYHEKLECLINEKLTYFRKVLLLDLHSFCVDFKPGADEDICLSNYNNQTASKEIMQSLYEGLNAQGYSVRLNTIRGRYILKKYKELFQNRIDCIQMELRYSQYIGDRYYGEEELNSWDTALFSSTQKKLQAAFIKLYHGLERA